MARILVIDDDQNLRSILTKQLESDGHVVLTASDGESGLKSAAAHRPDVVILDIVTPRMHGFAVIEAIRKDSSLAHTHIIVCSMKGYSSDARAVLNLGADRFLAKPIQPEMVSATIFELLGGPADASEKRLQLRVKFWGTRGSIPTPGPGTISYGGNTACTEVRCGEHILVFDAGTGICRLGESLLREFGPQPMLVHIFVGHTHWDHIQGFPFFAPAYLPGNEFFIYSMRGAGKPLEKVFRGQMDADYFPVPLTDMRSRLNFVELREPVSIGPLSIRFEYLNHPGIAIGFRVSVGGKSLVYLSDHESYSRLYGEEAGAREDQRIIDFVRGTDLLICEAQYTEEEYAQKKGWGHSTIEDALRMAAVAEVRQLILFHHDPAHADEFMDRLVDECQQKIRAASASFTCSAAREGQVIEL